MSTVIDTYALDGNKPQPDYVAAKAAGARGVYLKRYDAKYGNDAVVGRDCDRVRKAGLRVGLYFMPDPSSRAPSPKEQVAGFKRAPGDIQRDIDLPPGIDCEASGSGFKGLYRPLSELCEFYRQLTLEVEDQLDVSPMFYTGFFQYDDLGWPAWPWAARLPLWIKTAYRLAARSPVDTVTPPRPHAGNVGSDPKNYWRIPTPWGGQWLLQQKQGDALGFGGHSGTVDIADVNVLSPGMSNDTVKLLQTRLRISVTGTYDAATEAAVRALQAAKGLDVDGITGVDTWCPVLWLPA